MKMIMKMRMMDYYLDLDLLDADLRNNILIVLHYVATVVLKAVA